MKRGIVSSMSIIAVAFILSVSPVFAGTDVCEELDSYFGGELAGTMPSLGAACNVKQGPKYNSATLNKALNCLKNQLTEANTALAEAELRIASLEADVAALKGLGCPVEPVSTYEDDYVLIQLKEANKTGSRISLGFRITNKTAETLYLAQENGETSVVDDNATSQTVGNLSGIRAVDFSRDSTDPENFTAISANNTLTASWTSNGTTDFSNAHFIDASFGFVRYDVAGSERLTAGFTDVPVL